MITPLAIAVTCVALLAGASVAVSAMTGAFRWRAAAPSLALVEAGLIVQAVADVIALIRGHRAAEPGVHLAYLVTSVLVVPAAAVQVRGEDDHWSALLLAAALLVVAVVVVRMAATAPS